MNTSSPRERKPINPWLLVVGVPFAVFAVVVAGLLFVGYFTRGRLGPNDRRLPDGSILRVEKVTWGKSSELEFEFEPPSWPWIWRRHIQKAEFSPQSSDRLVIWISRRDSKTGQPLDVNWFQASAATNAWGEKIPSLTSLYALYEGKFIQFPLALSYSLSSGLFDPNRQTHLLACSHFYPFRTKAGHFSLRVQNDSGDVVATFDLVHPSPPTLPSWKPDPLPMTKTDGDLAVTLHRMRWETMNVGRELVGYATRIPDGTGNAEISRRKMNQLLLWLQTPRLQCRAVFLEFVIAGGDSPG
jgi:hypothetical protein